MTIDERELGALARQLPRTPIDPARRAALREAVVQSARPAAVRTRRRVAGLMIAAGAAAALAILALAREDADVAAPTHRATVQATAAADLQHAARIVRGVNDEVVRLRGGRVSIAVERLAADQRFRVIAGDGEVEVRGTAFDVVVLEDRLMQVVVHHGLVDVRLAGAAAIAVAGGEAWSRAEGLTKIASLAPPGPVATPAIASAPPGETPSVPPRDPAGATQAAAARTGVQAKPRSPRVARAPAPSPGTRPPPTPAPAPALAQPPVNTASRSTPAIASAIEPSAAGPAVDASPPKPSPPGPALDAPPPKPSRVSITERAFHAGREALRAGDFGAAADRFREAVAADPAASLAEDARYWRGIALARAGRDADARRALAEFLAQHARSVHAGRASIVAGNLLVKAGEHAAARARFEAALTDPDPGVQQTARAALAALPP